MARRIIDRNRVGRGSVPGGLRTTRSTRSPRAMPDDVEMSARAARLRSGRQSAGAGGRQGLAGSAIYSIQDMLNHPAVEWSRNQARGPAQGQVDKITQDVMGRLAEVGIYKDASGTWQIDLAKNAASRQKNTSAMPTAPAPTIPTSTTSGRGVPYPGPAKPPDPRSFPTTPTSTRAPGPPVSGGAKPPAPTGPSTTQAGPPVGGTTGGTLPRQGPVYTPKPAEPTGGTLPRQLPVIPAPQPTSKPPQPTGQPPVTPPGTALALGIFKGANRSGANLPQPVPEPGMNETWGQAVPPGKPPQPQTTMGPSPDQQTNPGLMNFSGGGYVPKGAGPINPEPIFTAKPPQPQGGTLPRQLPQQQVSGQYPSAWEDPNIRPIGYAESRESYAEYLRSMGYDERGNPLPKPAGPNPGGGGTLPRQPSGTPGTAEQLPRQGPSQQGQPAPAPRPGMPSPTGRPQAPTWPTMPNGQTMGQGNTNDLGGQIQARVQQMLAQRMGGAAQGAGQAGTGAMQGLAGLGERIQQQVQSRLGPKIAGGAPTDGVNNPALGGLAGLGDRIQQQVQGQIAGMPRPGTPNMPRPGMPNVPGGPAGPAPGNPGGGAGMPPGPGTIPQPPGGPAPGNPSPAPPTGPGTGTGTLGSYGNASIDQWDSAFIAAGNATGVDPRILKAMAEIESGGNGNIPLDQCRDDGYGDGGSCGLMQIKPSIWGSVSSTEEQIMQAAQILADYKAANPGATDKDALFAVYFPADDPNGTTQGSYSAKVDQLVAQMGDYNPGGGTTTPIEPGGGGNVPINQNVPIPNTANSNFPGSAPNQEPVAQMTPESVAYLETLAPGAGQAAINNDYGYKSQGPNYYCNYVNWQCDMHTGLDVPLGQNQEYNGLVSGKVVCLGGATSASYDGSPYQCGSYDTDDGTGIGNITVRTPKGAYVTYGHSQTSYVQMDQQVTPGQPIGTAGYANGYHTHLEVRLPIGNGGEYLMVDPNLYFNGYYCNIGFCPE